MDIKLQQVDLSYIEDISGGDNEFKKELIRIFLNQIPEFLGNMNRFLDSGNYADLAKEAHTAKSSVLIFRMIETGNLLKKIQLQAENDEIDSIAGLLDFVKADMEKASADLTQLLKEL